MKNKIRIGFVILHYQALEDTSKAIESLCSNLDTDEFHIVVVDNASPNETGKILIEKYQNNSKITVICNEKNTGFACGNNLGYAYLKKNYQVDYIVLMNNDIVFTEHSFLKKIEKEYTASEFSILGPMVMTADGKYTSSPIRTIPIKRAEIEFAIKEYKKRLLLNRLYLWPFYCLVKTFREKKKSTKIVCTYDKLCRQENVQIHGCFMVFSKKYIEQEDGLCNRTFLYCEEDILYLTALKNDYKIVYQPNIVIYHKEDASTNYTYQKSRDKNIFYYTEALKSEQILLEIYDRFSGKENI